MLDTSNLLPAGIIPDSLGNVKRQAGKLRGLVDTNIADIDVDPSALKNILDSELNILDTDFRSMIPEIPSLPSLNFQSELQSLMSLGADTSGGIAKLASLKDKFGGSLTSGGFDLDGIVASGTGNMRDMIGNIAGQIPGFELPTGGATELLKSGQLQGLLDAASNADLGSLTENLNPISDLVPNFELPSGALEAIQKAPFAKAPVIAAIKEKISKFDINDSPLNKITGECGDVVAAAIEKICGKNQYPWPNPEIPIMFPDELKDLSGQLSSVVDNLEGNIGSRINELGGGPAGLDVSSDDFSAIKDQLTKIKSQVLPSDVPVESGPMLSNLEGALGELKTQLENTEGISSNQVTDYVSGFDGVKDSFVKPAKVDQKGLVSQTAGKSAEYSEAEVVALSGSIVPKLTITAGTTAVKIFGEEEEEYVPTVPRTINGYHAEGVLGGTRKGEPIKINLTVGQTNRLNWLEQHQLRDGFQFVGLQHVDGNVRFEQRPLSADLGQHDVDEGGWPSSIPIYEDGLIVGQFVTS